jgi:hypothetical protein
MSLKDPTDELEVTIAQLIGELNGIGSPDAKGVAHDLELIYTQLDDIVSVERSEHWHNSALTSLIELTAPWVYDIVARESSHEARVSTLKSACELWFMVGHAIGEGSEHIVKCTCDKD